MFRRVVAGALMAVMTWIMPAMSGSAATPPDPFRGGQTIAGNQRALYEAVRSPSAVRFDLHVIGGVHEGDLTTYLDQWLDRKGWPEHDVILLLLFPDRNWDLRFALGTDFRGQDVRPAEVTGLLRVHYFPRARSGDPAGGLAMLLRQISRRMSVIQPE